MSKFLLLFFTISLLSFGIIKAEPGGVGQFNDLNKALKANRSEVLELTLSGYDSIPRSVFTFKNLKKLTVRNGLKSIPDNIFQLSSLVQMIFVDDQIYNIPTNIKFCKSLKDLRFINCELAQIPKELFELPALEKLMLKNNQIERLPNDFTDNFTLKELNLKFNKIRVLDECLQRLYGLETLYFSGNPIAVISGKWEDPRAFKKLHTVIMKDCNLERLPVFLTKNVRYLDVGNNKIRNINNEDVIMLRSLTFLSMDNNPLRFLNDEMFLLPKLNTIQIDKYETIIMQLIEQTNVCISYTGQDYEDTMEDLMPCGKKKGQINVFLYEPTKKKK